MAFEKKSLLRAFREFTSNRAVTKFVKGASKSFKAAEPFLRKPSMWNAVRGCVDIVDYILEERAIYGEDFFSDQPGWSVANENFICNIIVGKIHDGWGNCQVIKTVDQGSVVRIHEFDQFSIGYTYDLQKKRADSRLYMMGDIGSMQSAISQLLWTSIGSRNALLSKKSSESCTTISVIGDLFETKHDHGHNHKLIEHLERCKESGLSRSIMLYGPPGTGKSTLARQIVDKLNYTSFRIRIDDIGSLDNDTIMMILTILNPDACIIDDFDRAFNQVSLLEMLENLSRKVKLIVATVNNRDALDEALLRPGRFDEMLCIDRLSDAAIRAALGPECQDSFELVQDWPIAFIQEFVKRRKLYNAPMAEESMHELISRIARLRSDKRSNSNLDDIDGSFVQAKSRTNKPNSGSSRAKRTVVTGT